MVIKKSLRELVYNLVNKYSVTTGVDNGDVIISNKILSYGSKEEMLIYVSTQTEYLNMLFNLRRKL